jgi:hypothetical protein
VIVPGRRTSSRRASSSTSSRSRASSSTSSLAQCCALLAILVSCRASRSEPTGSSGAAGSSAPGNSAPGNSAVSLSAEPEHFRFAVPPAYVRHELRGEGSETLLAPPEALVQPSSTGIRVNAGNDFALEVYFQPGITALPEASPGAQRVASEKDLVVFKKADGYWFLVLRELVPEWDENERRRVACSSAGSPNTGRPDPDQRVFSRAAVEHMVAACRSLELPRLE